MKLVTTTRLSLILSALMLSGPGAFAQSSPPGDAAVNPQIQSAINQSATVQAIQTATFDTREQVLVDVEARMHAADALLVAQPLSSAAKEEVKQAGKALTASIRKARGSTAADWGDVRAELKESFSTYASVAIRAGQDTSASGK